MSRFDPSRFGPRADMQAKAAESRGVLAVLIAAVITSALISALLALLDIIGIAVIPLASLWVGLALGAAIGMALQRSLSQP